MYDDDYDDDEYDDDDELDDEYDDDDDDDDEYDDDEEDGFGDDDDNPSGYGEDPEPEDEDELKDDEGEANAKKSKKKGQGQDSAEGEIKGKVEGKKGGAPDSVKMNKLAKQLHCGPRTQKTCPFCKQKSIYAEPVGSTIIRSAIWYCVGMDRGIRYVCLNPKCKAYFVPGAPKARFKDNNGGKLSTTHGLHTAENPFSLRPLK